MRGGAIPLLAWGTLLAVLMAINWIWTGDAIQVGSFGFAVLVIWGGAGLAILCSRGRALRPGSPEVDGGPEVIPEASSGAMLAALGLASIVFGFVFGTFPIYFGAGLLLAAIGRLAIELRAERESRMRATRERRP
jgi:hypothetical protein